MDKPLPPLWERLPAAIFAARCRFTKKPTTTIDELVKNRNSAKFVIPAKAGIQLFQDVLDPGVRRGDGFGDFLRSRQN
jgi:hypothetical protein